MLNIAAFLKDKGITLKKDLGQNFLIDESVLASIVETANITDKDEVVEIGPGVGVLTTELAKHAKHVTAIELDKTLIPLLKEITKGGNLTIIEGNALSIPMPETLYKIVANIPYHITSPLLRHIFLESQLPPTSITLLIQKEVAERICNQKNSSLLSILIGLFGTPKLIRIVPPKAFFPPPKVDSAILHVSCFPKPITDAKTIDTIFQLTKIAFSQKRKMLRNSFGGTRLTIGGFQSGLELLSAANIDEKRRPQTLSIQEWIAIAKVERDNR